MTILGSWMTWLAMHGYWFILVGLIVTFCVRDPRQRLTVVRTLLILGGILVGSIFLAAAYGKMKPLPGFRWSRAALTTSLLQFEMDVQHYEVLSPRAAHTVAQVLPFFELFLGLWLVSGIGRRYSSLVASLLFSGFIAAIAYAYFRGLKIKCGCGIGEDEDVGPVAMLRDGLRFLLPALVVTVGSFWVRRNPASKASLLESEASATHAD